MRTIQLGLVLVLAVGPLQASAQSAAPAVQTPSAQKPVAEAALPVYDVSVIRTAAPGNGDRHVWTRLNNLEVRNMKLIYLLENAFDLPEDMIVGLPEWAKHTGLDIDAKTLDPDTARLRELTTAERRKMMQALLQDRLGLKWHYETRVLPSYDLLVAKSGAKLKPTVAKGHNTGTSVNDTKFTLTNVPVSDLAVVLADKLGRPVVDKTGLTGRYDIRLMWTPDQTVTSEKPDAPPPLLTAMQEQLGLKLKGSKDPVQVFVIDHLTPPTAN
ncbi:MAG TPA: TIGR03435 family protein [Edaphobacter sp.]|nr:TIGR03435 family protein [Edaphobacter sp.]